MFVQLTATWKLAEAQLTHAIREDASIRNHAAMFRRVADLMEAIETHVPGSEDELAAMVAFFVKRSSHLNAGGGGQRELDIAIDLMGRYRDAALPRGRSPMPANDSGRVRPGASYEPEDLAARIVASPERLAAIDRGYQYLATSPSNATFNRSTQIGMMCRHVVEVVGRKRFEDRGKPAIDRCFEDEPQDYAYDVEIPREGTRRIRCEIRPVRDRSGRLYCAVMRMTELTGEMRKVG